MQPKEVFRAEAGINQLIKHYKFDTVLDVGAGYGLHTEYFRKHGKTVTATDLAARFDGVVEGDYMKVDFPPHDLVWASHVLEHQLDVHAFLTKARRETKVGGYICITVPPLKHNIVGGHLSLWNAGLVLYRLILAGYDCSQAAILQYNYNITVIAQAKDFELPKDLAFDSGDIEKLLPWFPSFAKHGFRGDIKEHNWKR
jgi:SAM-dependent methyltransferase